MWRLSLLILCFTFTACQRTAIQPLPTLTERYPNHTATVTLPHTAQNVVGDFTKPEGYQPEPWSSGSQRLPIIPAPELSSYKAADQIDPNTGGRYRAFDNKRLIDPNSGRLYRTTPNGYIITEQGLKRGIAISR